nr:hypothetical protein CFP56_08919 [Quercus suber]
MLWFYLFLGPLSSNSKRSQPIHYPKYKKNSQYRSHYRKTKVQNHQISLSTREMHTYQIIPKKLLSKHSSLKLSFTLTHLPSTSSKLVLLHMTCIFIQTQNPSSH